MRNLVFIFLLFFPHLNYASFPVSEIMQNKNTIVETQQEIENNTQKKSGYISGFISVLLAIIGGFLLVMTIGAAFGGSSITYLYFFLSLASLLVSIFLGLKNVIKKKKGFIVSTFGLLLGLIGVFIILFSL